MKKEFCLLFVLLLIILSVPSISHAAQIEARCLSLNQKGIRQSGKLTINISTDKEEYVLGDPILVTVVVKNAGCTPIWVSNEFSRAITGMTAHMDVKLKKVGGEEIVRLELFAEVPPPAADYLYEWFIKSHLILNLNMFLGSTDTLAGHGYKITEAGQYELSVKLSDSDYTDPSWWRTVTEDQEFLAEVRKKLMVPIWSGDIKSKPVGFEVRKHEVVN